MMKMVSEFPHNDENLDTFLRETVGETEADPPKHGFIHLAIANAVMMRGVESEKYQDLSWMRTNQADLTILRPEVSSYNLWEMFLIAIDPRLLNCMSNMLALYTNNNN